LQIANAHPDRAERLFDEERQRADRAERYLEQERERVDEERKRVDELRAALADAVAAERIAAGEAAALRAELDLWRRMSWLQRVFGRNQGAGSANRHVSFGRRHSRPS
jgi:small-conductance mechanosensitive channel